MTAKPWPLHEANHPATKHYREDVFDIHLALLRGSSLLVWLGLVQTANIIAKRRAVNHAKRRFAVWLWVTLKWAAFQMPRCIGLENVEEFRELGPLDEDGKPIKAEKGVRSTRLLLRCLPGSIRITQTCRRSTMPWVQIFRWSAYMPDLLHSRTPNFTRV